MNRPLVRPQLEGLEERTLLNAYTVNLLGDNGGAQGAQSGQFSGNLRWCINQADLPANKGSSITFDQTVFDPAKPTTIALTNGELAVSNDMTITNAGGASTITVSGTDGKGGASRVFEIIGNNVDPQNVTTVSITGLTMTNGNASVFYTSVAGNQGGDIFNGGKLTLSKDIVQNGFSQGIIGGPAGRGGGIFNAEGQNGGPGAQLILDNTVVKNNLAEGNQGMGAGGGVYNDINATLTVENGSQIQFNTALGDSTRGAGTGGGIYNAGTLAINPSGSSSIVIEDNVAKGGVGFPGGDARGGGVFNSGFMTLQNVDFRGNQALGGAGVAGGPGAPGGPGGNAQGGGIYNGGSSSLLVSHVTFDVDPTPANLNGVLDPATGNPTSTADEAIGGTGGKGGDGAVRSQDGGNGGAGGMARGGAVASTSGGLSFVSASFTSSLAKGGDGGAGGVGFPGFLPTSGTGDPGGHGGAAGDAGDAFGGAVFNSSGALSFSGDPFVANKAAGGQGGLGGDGAGGDSGPAGGNGGAGGFGGAGGIGGGAQGGGFYNANAVLTISGSSFTANAAGTGNQAVGGNGGNGGNGGFGGQGGDGNNGITGIGGAGGFGGKGGDTRRASGGAGEDLSGDAQIGATFTSSLVHSGTGGQGGNGGNGGNSGTGVIPPTGLYGGAGGNGGAGGSSGPALGGALAATSSEFNVSSSTFGGSNAALANQVIGGAGGNGGTGGNIGTFGHPTTTYVVAADSTHPEGTLNPAGNGGNGGNGASVSGGAVSVTSAPLSGIDILSRGQGLNFGQSGGFQPPNPQGAAGTKSYVEATNKKIAIYNLSNLGTPIKTDSLSDFFATVGGLPRADIFSQFNDPAVVWDDQIQRFIVVAQDVDGFYNNGIVTQNKSFLDIAVSTSDNPATLTKSDWSFYQISTTETQNGVTFDPQFPGNIGWNSDALVVSLNMYGQTGVENHVQVNTISMSALTTPGTALSEGSNAFQFDFNGANLRPTVMHDSAAGDPMWFVQAGSNNASVNVVELTDPLSATAVFTSSSVAVNAFSPAVAMLQPNGQTISSVGSDIGKVAERNGLLVTAQTVSDQAGDSDTIQWYVIDVSSGAPLLQQQGDVGGGPGVYDAFPSIDINANGEIGMTYAQSGIGPGQFLSMYVTGRSSTDTGGTMRTPVVVQPGLLNYTGSQLGPLSAINVGSDGSFWALNEFADLENSTNWSTAIANFIIQNPSAPFQTVHIDNTTFTSSAIVSGNGGAGGQAGLGSDDGKNHGINGLGANGGLAQGGAIFLSAASAQGAVFDTVTIASSSAKAGAGGAGAINNVPGAIVTVWYKPAFGSDAHVSRQPGTLLAGLNGFGSKGGDGGSVEGVGIAAVDYALDLSTTTLSGGVGTAGVGGVGGGAGIGLPSSWDGGHGGNGGLVQGGGVYLSNNLKSPTPLNFSFNGGSVSNYNLAGGVGGSGGNAGASTSANRQINVAGGVGGLGGQAQGGGIYVFASSKSVNAVTLSNLNLMGDQITAGTGGQGGAGFLANGGLGGFAQGGAVFNTSLNITSGQTSSLSISASTLADDGATGGTGGNAGSGTTPNGGRGGAGGNAGNADGGALYNGGNTPLTIVNSTFGGGSTSSNTKANANILTSGLGGRGGNAGTPAGVIKNDGGNGGNGGSVHGGNVYNASLGALFINDTLVFGDASVTGLGGPGGSGAGSGGQPGSKGNSGLGIAGGYFATDTSGNKIGNTILAFNSAATDSDAAGKFTTLGNNLLTSTNGTTGFDTSSGGTDQIVTATYSDTLGPLLNNGGSTMTDAVLPGSVAINAGNTSLLTTPPFSTNPVEKQIDDQRGAGFARTFNNTVSAGALQFLPPVLTTLSPLSVVQGSPGFNLTINGSNFASGATVLFGKTTLTPLSSSSTKLVVAIPTALLTTPGTVPVTVQIPDGSGITGNTASSAAVNFTILATPFTLVNPGDQSGYVGAVVSVQVKPATGFNASNFDATNLPPGLSIDPDTGIISGTIAANGQSGSPFTVQVSATDDLGNPANVTFKWTVGAPLVLNPIAPQTNNEGDTVALLVSAPPGYVPNGFLAVGLPPGLSINTTTGLISGKIDPRGAGAYAVTVTPTNNNGQGSTSFNWTVLDTTPPTLTNPGTQSSAAGQDIDLPIQGVDADSGSFTATGLPPGLLIDANGVIFGTIAANAQGSYAVKVQAADGSVSSAPISFLWLVNGSVAPPASTTPVSPPGTVSQVANQGTSTTIANVSNQYVGLVQVETVTIDVTSANGAVVNEGVVAIQVDGQTVFVPVHNGLATATFATGLLDLNLFNDLLFSHPLTASYSDSAGLFASSGASTTLPAIWIDFFLTLLAVDLGQVDQLQS